MQTWKKVIPEVRPQPERADPDKPELKGADHIVKKYPEFDADVQIPQEWRDSLLRPSPNAAYPVLAVSTAKDMYKNSKARLSKSF